MVAAILAGAAGYVVKLTRSSHIATAIRAVGAGKSLIEPSTIDRVRRLLLSEIDEMKPTLTEDDRGILTHVVEGLTNSQIAERMAFTDDATADRISSLVERMLGSMSAAPVVPGSTPSGRHRRPDS